MSGIVIGLTGPNASGKGEAAGFLVKRDFSYHSLSDLIREEAVSRGLTTGRDDLISVGNDLRMCGGAGVLAEMVIPRLGGRDLVDSIRNPAEVEALRRVEGFVLLAVTAPAEIRYRRALQRSRPGDPLETLEAFLAKEREEESPLITNQQLSATAALADHVLVNDSDIETLRSGLEVWLERLEAGFR